MKVITLTEPWATLVVIGAKQFETRSWQRPPQGRVLIHAAKGMPDYARDAVEHLSFRTALGPVLNAWTVKDLLAKLHERRGKILGSAEHIGCKPTHDVYGFLSPHEEAFGDYGAGRYAWELVAPLAYRSHIPVRGMLGIWQLPSELEAAVRAAASEVQRGT